MARSGDGEWIFLEKPWDRGGNNRPAHQYQPRCAEFPRESYVGISNKSDAEVAISDQIEKFGSEIDRDAFDGFCQLLASLQTAQYHTFSSLLYWRNGGVGALQEPDVFCSDILIARRSSAASDVTSLDAVEPLAQDFCQRLQRAGTPKAKYRRNAIHLRLMVTVFGTKIDPQPLGYSLEIKILGGGSSKENALNQWAKAVELMNSALF
jgi:hypothetical protein